MRNRREAVEERREGKLKDWNIVVPGDAINEQAIIGAMLVDLDVADRLSKLFPPEAFRSEDHKPIVAAIREARRKKLVPDPAVLSRLDPDIDIRIVEAIQTSRPDLPPNLDHHIRTLSWDWKRAQVTRGPIASIVEALQDPTESPERVRALARSLANAFEDEAMATPFVRDSKTVIDEMVSAVKKRIAGDVHLFGIGGLDFREDGQRRLRPGPAPGECTILTGMSGSGKTTFAGHMILGLAEQGKRIGVGAWEVRAPMTMELLATMKLGWNRGRTLDGLTSSDEVDEETDQPRTMNDAEVRELRKAAAILSRNVVFLDNPFQRGSTRGESDGKKRIRNSDHLDVLEEHVEAMGCDVYIFDLFDRVLVDRQPNDEQEAIWRLLEMTERLRVHSVVVHQQLIKGDGVRADRKPSLQGLKGSSAYVDAGSLIIAPHLPARWKNVPDDALEIYGLKQRFGPPFAVEFDWNPNTGQIAGGRDIPNFDVVGETEQRSEGDNAWGTKRSKGRAKR